MGHRVRGRARESPRERGSARESKGGPRSARKCAIELRRARESSAEHSSVQNSERPNRPKLKLRPDPPKLWPNLWPQNQQKH